MPGPLARAPAPSAAVTHGAVLRLLLLACGVLLLHRFLWRLFMELPRLHFDDYFDAILITGIWRQPALLTFMAVGLTVLGLAWRRLRWRELDPTGATRAVVFVAAGVLAWAFATYDFNHLYDQAHLLDRGLLLGLWLLILVHPAFAFPFLVELQIILFQIYYPLVEAGWIWPDKRLPFDCLVLFCAFLLVRAPFRAPIGVFWYLTLCLTGGAYAHAAIRKMLQGPHLHSWLIDNHLSNIIVSSYANGGWLRFLGDEGVARLASWTRPFDLALAVATLAIELSGFLIVASRRSTRLVLAAFPVLHAAILATTGIFFWKWILFDLALLWALARFDPRSNAAGGDSAQGTEAEPSRARGLLLLRAPASRWASLVLIAASPLFFANVAFSWFDSRFVNYFEIHGVGESGRRYRVDPRFFAPYDTIFQQSRFYYLLRDPVLVGTYGSTPDHDLAQALERASVADIPEIRQQFGRVWFHPRAAQSFAEFVARWMTNAQQRGGRPFPPHWLAPPFHFQTSVPLGAFDFQERLRAVEVDYVELLFTGSNLELVARRPVLAIRLEN